MLNTNQKGAITEAGVIYAFTELGYTVLKPFRDGERYDLVVDIGGKLIKLQCKTSRPKQGGSIFVIESRSVRRVKGEMKMIAYTADEIDYFATIFGGKCYLIPVEECGVEKYLRIKPTKNRQAVGVSWAEDYELERVIRRLL